MKTSLGHGCAEALDMNSLEQIKAWADKSAVMLKNEAQRISENGGKLSQAKPYLEDMDAFRMLSAAIMDVRI